MLDEIKFVIPAIMGFLIVTLGKLLDVRLSREQTRSSKERIKQAESEADAHPNKIRPAWQLARVTLEAYFNRNLSQIASIFWLSVFVMTAGFGIIVWGISQSIQSPTTLGPAAITTLAGVITEFVGATFMVLYWSTIKQAMTYSRTLERINSVGMAMQILDTIPDETKADDLKNKTKATIVEMLIRQSYKIPEGSDDKDAGDAE